MRIFTDDTAVLVIDYQKKLVPAMHDKERFISRSKILLKGLMALDVPAIVTQQYTRGLGETIPEIKNIEGMPDAFDKITFSCLMDEHILQALERQNVKNVIVCGAEAHICVLQTVIDLIDEEYNVYVAADCIASRAPEDKAYAIERFKQEGAYITTAEAVIYELLQRAGSDTFKRITRIVKEED